MIRITKSLHLAFCVEPQFATPNAIFQISLKLACIPKIRLRNIFDAAEQHSDNLESKPEDENNHQNS